MPAVFSQDAACVALLGVSVEGAARALSETLARSF